MRKIVLFRISSKGYPKVKVEGINKYDSLTNLTRVFKDWEIICVADNCDEALVTRLKKDYQFAMLIETQLGNPGSFWKLYEIGLDIGNDEDIFYFAEDDYLHLPEAPDAIEEGLKFFDYVTLYDHPDKYILSNGPINPYTKENKFSESTEIVEGQSRLWRTSNSTTMTLAITGKTLREDADIWLITKTAKKDFDFDNFCVLTKQPMRLKTRQIKQIPRRLQFWTKPKRYLGICIPGLSLHLEQAYLKKNDLIRFDLPPQSIFDETPKKTLPNHKSKLLDVFLFYNELDLLKARLAYLGPIVDAFIISEANIDFSGKPKNFVLNEDLISKLPFSEKIIYHREFINLNSPSWLIRRVKYFRKRNRFLWKIQDAQRNSTLKCLKYFSNEDIIIFGDLDEFPSKDAIHSGLHLLENQTGALSYSCEQIFYYGNLNNASVSEKFYGSVITNLRTFRKCLPHKIRSNKNDFPHISNGGWHFSYFMDDQKIVDKINAIADVENLSGYKHISEIEIREKINTHIDLFDRKIRLSHTEKNRVPTNLFEILKRYLPSSCL